MSRQDIEKILEKAIQKAIDNGWKYKEGLRVYSDELFFEDKLYYCMIFNHDFAKALWGEAIVYANNSRTEAWRDLSNKSYLYHLQMMVIADDPIAYLGEHL